MRGARDDGERAAAWRRYQKLNSFRAERMAVALADLARLDPAAAGRTHVLRERVIQTASTEALWATTTLDGLVRSGATLEATPVAAWRAEAASLVPCRLAPGPIDVAMCLQTDHPELLPRLWALNEALGPSAHDYTPVLQYWSNGNHSVAEIGEMAWLELGRPADEHTLAYFKLLAEAGLIELRRTITHDHATQGSAGNGSDTGRSGVSHVPHDGGA